VYADFGRHVLTATSDRSSSYKVNDQRNDPGDEQ
jgi:hypothetical protein